VVAGDRALDAPHDRVTAVLVTFEAVTAPGVPGTVGLVPPAPCREMSSA